MRFKDGDRVEDETKSRGTVEDIEEIGEDTFYSVAWDISGCQSTFKVGDELDATMKLVNPDDPEPNPYEVELRKIAVTLGEGDDPFAAWETLDLIMTEHADQKKIIDSLTQKLEAIRAPASQEGGRTNALTDLEEVRKAVFGDVGDEPDVYSDYDRCSELSGKMRKAIAALTPPSTPQPRPEGLADLEILARFATPGPHHIYTHQRDDNNWRANEEFHKAATPQLVLSLIEAWGRRDRNLP